ncbi:hypothetical protein JIQ42_04708 [Leishmania sp. Namibia]|uniref:hypothetical protein n=1 Tax=Leishmania sp. Namibia TaxID=2802991 RepID=UPI001B4925C2|nr:hypothetical protein JIQ42_04708 [Leishmania sp. Namibia]
MPPLSLSLSPSVFLFGEDHFHTSSPKSPTERFCTATTYSPSLLWCSFFFLARCPSLCKHIRAWACGFTPLLPSTPTPTHTHTHRLLPHRRPALTYAGRRIHISPLHLLPLSPLFLPLAVCPHPLTNHVSLLKASMRRLPSLVTTAPPPFLVVSNVSRACAGARTTSPCHKLATGAVSSASSAALRSFTSFEAESELSLAQHDLEQLQSALHRTTSASKASACAKPPQMAPSFAATPSLRCSPPPLVRPEPVVLPALLQRSRWHNVVHERYRASVPGYVGACTQVLWEICRMWKVCAASRSRCEEDGAGCFAGRVHALLRRAHADALLVLLEEVAGIHNSEHGLADSAAGFSCELTVHLVDILARRPVELSGKRMAHLSKILLSCPYLLAATPSTQDGLAQALVEAVQEGVWHAFTFLCYATRRSLRRRQNVDCLEALLCGVYMRAHQDPATAPKGCREGCTLPLASSILRSSLDAAQSGRQRRHGSSLLPPRLMAKVRQAALCHLVHRCLLNGASAKAAAADAITEERESLLLAWVLLVAREDLDPVVHAAVVYRLRKNPGLTEGSSSAGALPVCVDSWRQLALRVAAVLPPSDVGGQRATALTNGPEIFRRTDQTSKDTGGWAVAPVDRLLLSTLHQRSPTQKQASLWPWSATEQEDTRGVEAAWPLTENPGTRCVLNGAAAALHAYARLRWKPLSVSEVDQSVPNDGPFTLGAVHLAPSPTEACAFSADSAIAKECEDVIEAAADLPLHTRCLAEVLCTRLLRCLHRWKGASPGGVALTTASSGAAQASPTVAAASTQRRILAALQKLLPHTRTEVVMAAMLELQSEAHPTADTRGNAKRNAHRDSSRIAPSSAHIWPSMPQRACWPLISAVCRHADDAVRAVREWMCYREMMATPLALASVQRLREWLLALPGSQHSSQLVKVLREWAEMETRKLSGTSSLARACRSAWTDVAQTALEQHAAQALLAALDGRCAAAVAAQAPSCSPCGAELRRTYAAMSGPASAPLRQLQWIANANSSAVREWRWSTGVTSLPIEWATGDQSESLLCPTLAVPAAVLLVEATEADLTDTEHDAAAQMLCLRCFPSIPSFDTFSWSDRLACRALERAQATSSCATQPVVKSDAAFTADRSCAADGDATASPRESVQCNGAVVSAAALHYLISRGNRTALSAPGLAAVCSVTELDDAIRTLAVYVEYLQQTRHGRPDDGQCGERASDRRLRCAAAAYINCLSDAWRMTKRSAASTTSALSRDRIDESVLLARLPSFYLCALRLYDTLMRDTAELDNVDEVPHTLPRLPEALHEAAFRALVHGLETQRHTIETTLLLADSIARRWASRTTVSTTPSSGVCSTAAPTTSLSKGTRAFCLPLSVYQLVLATYAADRAPLPHHVRACCEAALSREAKHEPEGPW